MRTVEDALHVAELRALDGLEPGKVQRYGSEPAGAPACSGHGGSVSEAPPASVSVLDLQELATQEAPSLWCVCIASDVDPAAQVQV